MLIGAQVHFEKTSTPRDMIVRRGDNYNMFKDLGIDFSKGNLENIKGSLVESKAFLSTSTWTHRRF